MPGRHLGRAAERQPRPPQLRPDAHADVAQRLVERDALVDRLAAVAAVSAVAADVLHTHLVERARHAHDEGVGHQLHQAARLVADAEGRARAVGRHLVGLGGLRRSREEARLRRRDLDLLAEHDADRGSRRGHHLVGRLGDRRQLQHRQLGAVVLRRRHAHHRGRDAAGAGRRHQEDVAARDAVDVGDRDRDGRHLYRRERARVRVQDRDVAALDLVGAEALQHLRDRLRGGGAEAHQGVSRRHASGSSPGRSVICTARREPLRPGWAWWIGTSSA